TCSKRSIGMIEDTPNPQSSNGGGDRSLCIGFVSRLEPKTLKHSLTHLLIKLTSLLGPKGKRSGSHKMSRSYDPKRQTQQENGCLCVFEINQLAHYTFSHISKVPFDKTLSKLLRTLTL